MAHLNQNPEQVARDRIDQMLRAAGWSVQSKDEVDLSASRGVAVREYLTSAGPAQVKAIRNLEHSFKNNYPRALIQMATGAGKSKHWMGIIKAASRPAAPAGTTLSACTLRALKTEPGIDRMINDQKH